MTQYLRKAPTLLVIGVTGFVAYTVLCAEGESGPPKAESKPPASEKIGPSVASNTLRNPFLMVKPEQPAPVEALAVASTDRVAKRDGPASKAEAAELPPEPQDQILETMRLIGTFVDSREQLAVINNKVYSRGDQLRGSDGLMLPYIVTEVRKDRTLVRRGRREFEIAFSNVPGTAGPRAAAPTKPADDKAMAKAQTSATFTPIAKSGKGPKGGNGAQPGMNNDTDSQRSMLMQLLSSLGGSQGGGSGGGGLPGGLGGLTGSNSSALNSLLNPTSIGTGLDAISGKFDNIGQAGGNGP